MAEETSSLLPDIAALRPHSCSSCFKLLIQNNSPSGIIARFRYEQVAKNASLGCILFQSHKGKLDNLAKPWCREFHTLVVRAHIDYAENSLMSLGLNWSLSPDIGQEIDDLLQPFVQDNHPASEFIRVSPFNLCPGSTNSFAWMKRYFDRCRENHSVCNERLNEHRRNCAMPKRLLDVGRFEEPIVRLFTTDPTTGENYAIASYAWGIGSKANAIHQAQTTKANVGPRMEHGLQLASLPRTVRDLIEVTRSIGHRNLWIDAFCIVQNDPVEQRHQLDRMVEFYKRADVLISAASASHCDEGFLQPRNVDQCYGAIYELPFKWEFPNRKVEGSMLLCEKTLNYISDEDPLHMRIWTYQEHLVSTRVISFGTRQIKWKCQKDGNVVDGGDYSISDGDLEHHLDEAFSPSPYSSENLVEINWRVQAWMKIVEKYSFRRYSRPQDRLPAFIESISYLAPFVGWPTSECLAGIWKADAARQLLWKKEKPLSAEESNPDQISGPSWSWATLPGGVVYDFDVQLRDLNDSFKTIEFVEEPETPLRLVTEGYIQEAYWGEEFFGNLMKRKPFRSVENSLLVEVAWDVEVPPQPMWLLNVAPNYQPCMDMGLVLVRVAEDPDLFARRGFFRAVGSGLPGLNGRSLDNRSTLYSDQQKVCRNISIV